LFFEQCAIEVTKWIKKNITIGKYSLVMDILVDLPSKDIENFVADGSNIQIKRDGSFWAGGSTTET